MTISPWRLIHLWLAVISAVFLLIASITGIILAFEPVYEQSFGYSIDAEELTVSQLLENTSNIYDEISTIKKDHNGFYQITVFDENGESTFYIDPSKGEKLGGSFQTPGIFDFARVLHRSLYLKQTGRFIIGATSVFLVFICVAGFVLVVRKQGGITLYFKKVIKEGFYQDKHTTLGKIFIWPILFVSLTGGVLFLERFEVLSTDVSDHSFEFEGNETLEKDSAFKVFEETKLSDFKELAFPFSDFEDDYFELKLTNSELLISQKTGAVISQIDYSQGRLLSIFSFKWHTGEGQTWWAILLGTTSVSLVFFIYSGFTIYIKRKPTKSGWKNAYPKDQCDIIIAVGSELGATAEKASIFHQGLIRAGVKAYIVSMNEFEYSPSMKKLILMASTYGKGDAPSNARQFIKKFNLAKDLHKSFQYAVVGFGSKSYPDFCQYAIDLDELLRAHPSASPLLPISKLEDHAHDDLKKWSIEVGKKLAIDLDVDFTFKTRETTNLQLINREFSKNPSDQTFLLELSATQKQLKGLESGDLLAITPEDGVPRYYSMSVDLKRRRVLISIKLLDEGIVSKNLANLEIGDRVDVSFKKNPSFHFPRKKSNVLLIANGTGIGPFLGMLESNNHKIPTTLFWGGQNETSFDLYKQTLNELHRDGKLRSFNIALSRIENDAKYVQQLVKENEKLVISTLEDQGTIMICGSLKMQEGVEKVLNEILVKNQNHQVGYFKEQGLVRADCY